ncbi:MAG: LysM peptidoglycan-binding domain-containing protein, partial [Verrucomicrobiaceae bacterium]
HTLPRLGNRQMGAPPVAVLAATNGQAPGAREFAMKTGQENTYQRDDHADHPVAEDSVPAPRSSPASAKPAERTGSKTQEKAREKSVPRAARVSEDGDHPPKAKQTKEKSDAAKPKSPTQSGGGSRTHVVQKGDTVYNVSRRYGLSASEVMRANNISDPGKLQLGQVLKITVRR